MLGPLPVTFMKQSDVEAVITPKLMHVKYYKCLGSNGEDLTPAVSNKKVVKLYSRLPEDIEP